MDLKIEFSESKDVSQATNYSTSFKECWELHYKTKPLTQSDSTTTYGTFGMKSPFSHVHFENNYKFFTLTRLEWVTEISHWSNITREETIDLLHTGALLKGLQ